MSKSAPRFLVVRLCSVRNELAVARTGPAPEVAFVIG